MMNDINHILFYVMTMKDNLIKLIEFMLQRAYQHLLKNQIKQLFRLSTNNKPT